MLLRSHRRYAESAEFDPVTGALLIRDEGTGGRDAGGFFGMFGDVWVVLYRQGDDLALRMGDVTLAASEIGEVRHRLDRGAGRCTLTVRTIEGDRVEFTYDASTDMDFEFDPTPFVELEDFDFGLFVANVFGDPARRRRMCE